MKQLLTTIWGWRKYFTFLNLLYLLLATCIVFGIRVALTENWAMLTFCIFSVFVLTFNISVNQIEKNIKKLKEKTENLTYIGKNTSWFGIKKTKIVFSEFGECMSQKEFAELSRDVYEFIRQREFLNPPTLEIPDILPSDYEIDKLAQASVEGNAKQAVYKEGAKSVRDYVIKKFST